MIDLYVALIISGRRTFQQVPKRYRTEVEELLNSIGLDQNGDPITTTD